MYKNNQRKPRQMTGKKRSRETEKIRKRKTRKTGHWKAQERLD